MPTTTLNLKDFEGDWALKRSIRDDRAQLHGDLSGHARLSPSGPDKLIYEEQGQLSYGEQAPIEATRRYVWRVHDDGIEMLFEDLRPFHVIDLRRTMPHTTHHCDPDMYSVSYDFTRWPIWSSTWRVVGPKKEYRMLSQYWRTS